MFKFINCEKSSFISYVFIFSVKNQFIPKKKKKNVLGSWNIIQQVINSLFIKTPFKLCVKFAAAFHYISFNSTRKLKMRPLAAGHEEPTAHTAD
jgi:hypothetical protein